MNNFTKALLTIMLSLGAECVMAQSPDDSMTGDLAGMCFFEYVGSASGRLSEAQLIPTFQDIEKCEKRSLLLPMTFVLQTDPAPCKVQSISASSVKLMQGESDLENSAKDEIKKAYAARCAAEKK